MEKPEGGFYVNEGYLFKERKICIPQVLQRKLLVQETREGGLIGHFGVEKTLGLIGHSWPYIRKHVQRY